MILVDTSGVLAAIDPRQRHHESAARALTRPQRRILSPFVLLEQRELEFYRSRTLALGRLRGQPVDRHGRGVGLLQDVVVADDGQLVAVIVENERVPFDAALRFAPQRRSAA